MKEAPTKWTAIAVQSPSSGSFEALPGAFISIDLANARSDIETRNVSEGGRIITQARKKGGR